LVNSLDRLLSLVRTSFSNDILLRLRESLIVEDKRPLVLCVLFSYSFLFLFCESFIHSHRLSGCTLDRSWLLHYCMTILQEAGP